MKFGQAFLGRNPNGNVDEHIAENVDILLQSISPEVAVHPALEHVTSSNLCFGVPMNWALQEANRNNRLRTELRDCLNRFENRLIGVTEIDLTEDVQGNYVKFSITGTREGLNRTELIELETKISRLDLTHLEEGV